MWSYLSMISVNCLSSFLILAASLRSAAFSSRSAAFSARRSPLFEGKSGRILPPSGSFTCTPNRCARLVSAGHARLVNTAHRRITRRGHHVTSPLTLSTRQLGLGVKEPFCGLARTGLSGHRVFIRTRKRPPLNPDKPPTFEHL